MCYLKAMRMRQITLVIAFIVAYVALQSLAFSGLRAIGVSGQGGLPDQDSVPDQEEIPPGLVAQTDEISITEKEFYHHLIDLFADGETGESLLEQMIHETALRQEMARRKISVTTAMVQARCDELDRALKSHSGGQKGLLEYIGEQKVDEEEFLRALRLSVAHDVMARDDFGLDRDVPVPPEKLNLWLKELLSRKKVAHTPRGALMATVDGSEITATEFGQRLVSHLGKERIAGLLNELIGIRLIPVWADGLGLSLTESDMDEELKIRQDKLHGKKGFEEISYSDWLNASAGQTVDDLKKTERFRAEVLMKKIARSLLTRDDHLRQFEKKRNTYELRYGRAARLATIFLKAALFPSDTLNRSFDDAADELKELRKRIEKGEATFEGLAHIWSEFKSGDKVQLELGTLTLGVPGFREIVDAALKAEIGAVLGPFRTPDGCHLVKVLGQRGPVDYDSVREIVADDARQALYADMLSKANIRKRY